MECSQHGIKQGGVLGSVLLCIYIDNVLNAVCSSRLGCFIGIMLTGILAHADNTVLLAPTVQAVCKMLLICEEYVAAFCEPLNAKKSKCVICISSYKHSFCFIV